MWWNLNTSKTSIYIYITDIHWCNWFLFFHFSLSLADLGLVVVMVVDKCVAYHYLKYNMVEPLWFRLSYPYFWHPIKGIFLCATILMVVAVSAERFRAICYPFIYRHVSKFDNIISRMHSCWRINFLINQSPHIYILLFVHFLVATQICNGCIYSICNFEIAKIFSLPIEWCWWRLHNNRFDGRHCLCFGQCLLGWSDDNRVHTFICSGLLQH